MFGENFRGRAVQEPLHMGGKKQGGAVKGRAIRESGSTSPAPTVTMDKINPLVIFGFLQFFRVVSSDYGKPKE